MSADEYNNIYIQRSKSNYGLDTNKYYPWWLYVAPEKYNITAGGGYFTNVNKSSITKKNLSDLLGDTNSLVNYIQYNASGYVGSLWGNDFADLGIKNSSDNIFASIESAPNMTLRKPSDLIKFDDLLEYSTIKDQSFSMTTSLKHILYGGTVPILLDRTDGVYDLFTTSLLTNSFTIRFHPNDNSDYIDRIFYLHYPPEYCNIFIELQGGGGGGGGYSTTTGQKGGGSGGAGGGYTQAIMNLGKLSIAHHYGIRIGTGGSAGGKNNNGKDGAPTYLYIIDNALPPSNYSEAINNKTTIMHSYGGYGGSGTYEAHASGGSTYFNNADGNITLLQSISGGNGGGRNGSGSSTNSTDSKHIGGDVGAAPNPLGGTTFTYGYGSYGNPYNTYTKGIGGGGGGAAYGGYLDRNNAIGYGYGGRGSKYDTYTAENGRQGCAVIHIASISLRQALAKKTEIIK